MKEKYILDNIDKVILQLLQENSALPSKTIADKVGLSPTSVQRRIKNLQNIGIIEREIAVVSSKHAKKCLFIVAIELERGGADAIDILKRNLKAFKEVQQCYYTIGTSDFVLIVTANSMEDFELFTREAFFSQKLIRKFTTIPVMDSVKVGLCIPL
jgi:Lrp/AsnC family transcriptional regulator, leucine-responsive regulatory protein